MNLVTRTLASSYLQTCLLMNANFVLTPETTLNELYAIQNGVAPISTPTLGYFAIGNGGHKITVGANGIPLTLPVQHAATDAALYNGLPFILRPINNDIDTASQANYALRRIETHGGNQYIAYYLKRLPVAGIAPTMQSINTVNGVSTAAIYTPTSANLNPTPPALNSAGVNLVSGNYVAASANMNIALSANDVAELLNVATVLYGDPAYAIISEVALCSGLDKVVQSATYGNATIPFKEAIAVQVISFINTYFALSFNSTGLDILLDCGSSEPLFSLV
jgi:hypothetical protein